MENFKHIKVTTTSSLQNVEIEEYIEPISVNIVIGMNFFKDFLTGFRDVFGGKSNTYTKSLEKINEQAIYELKRRAHYLNANYVIGLSIDNDEISSQGKSMLMVTAMGTAVRVAGKAKNVIKNATSINVEALEQLSLKAKLLESAEKDELVLNDNKWDLIIENQVSELIPFLLTKLTNNLSQYDVKNNIILFFDTLEREHTVTEVFKFLVNNEERDLEFVLEVIKELNLVDYDKNLKLLSSENKYLNRIGASIAVMHKETYFKSDLKPIRETILILEEKFPVKAKFLRSKETYSENEIDVWKCECGTENNLERDVCRECRKDIHGFKDSEIDFKEIKENLIFKLSLLEKNFS
ncbi:heavy metal-binding domain-containing protein [Cellulophaga sp. HaHaR_3_176]|uniref:heavy metal-binding domain-containing protein n=1 Tax=Cellulophaga sp. HaHaR_3_176 TaxID=1942464 RepID=UPI001C1F8093|nr:heavy metal-binding domain-containing protein [Cellulophaga sp. HaHaR_3_176]QWX84366.1 heavy metal-binding domain-containing protein [Cellulophaga sp. HaHaR_3_176]